MTAFRPDEANSVYIGLGTELTGSVEARDSIVIDGFFEGEIACDHLIVGPSGVVKGAINVATADIAGHVDAELSASRLLSVRATGRVEGRWRCAAIEAARGAVLSGAAGMAEVSSEQRRLIETRLKQIPVVATPPVEGEIVEAPTVPAAPARITPRKLPKLTLRAPRPAMPGVTRRW
jgi:cytoskeletal protein CcmA (bactofilin family)